MFEMSNFSTSVTFGVVSRSRSRVGASASAGGSGGRFDGRGFVSFGFGVRVESSGSYRRGESRGGNGNRSSSPAIRREGCVGKCLRGLGNHSIGSEAR